MRVFSRSYFSFFSRFKSTLIPRLSLSVEMKFDMHALALMYSGGKNALTALQTVSIVSGLPLTIVIWYTHLFCKVYTLSICQSQLR